MMKEKNYLYRKSTKAMCGYADLKAKKYKKIIVTGKQKINE